jgi:murein DD-endopeptidase MepM/ murein hydrolase activator NlpD
VGSTGWSTGSHLHLEAQKVNGRITSVGLTCCLIIICRARYTRQRQSESCHVSRQARQRFYPLAFNQLCMPFLIPKSSIGNTSKWA